MGKKFHDNLMKFLMKTSPFIGAEGACQAIWTQIMGGDSKFCVNKKI